MATVEIEIGENGEIGQLPESVQKFLDKQIDKAYQKGANKAERAFKTLVVDPKEVETLRTKAKELDDLQLSIAERDKNYEAAQQIRDKRHQDELASERTAHQRAKQKIRESVGKTIRAAAVEAGARAESLDELERLIGADVDFDDKLDAFVKGPDGNPLATDTGEPMSLEGYVKGYLDKKPHHKAGIPAKGGNAPGGATHRGAPPKPPTGADALRQALDSGAVDPATTKAYIGNVLMRRG
jgi:hypothetical protein